MSGSPVRTESLMMVLVQPEDQNSCRCWLVIHGRKCIVSKGRGKAHGVSELIICGEGMLLFHYLGWDLVNVCEQDHLVLKESLLQYRADGTLRPTRRQGRSDSTTNFMRPWRNPVSHQSFCSKASLKTLCMYLPRQPWRTNGTVYNKSSRKILPSTSFHRWNSRSDGRVLIWSCSIYQAQLNSKTLKRMGNWCKSGGPNQVYLHMQPSCMIPEGNTAGLNIPTCSGNAT